MNAITLHIGKSEFGYIAPQLIGRSIVLHVTRSNEVIRLSNVAVEDLMHFFREGGWMIYPGKTRVDVNGIDRDAWWEDLSGPVTIATERGWCLIPWGPLSWPIALTAMLSDGASKSNLTVSKLLRGNALEIVRVASISLRDVLRPEGAVFLEEVRGKIAVGKLFHDGNSPSVLFASPAATEFLGEMACDASGRRRLREDVEYVKSIDNTGSQRAQWILRPKTVDSFLQLCALTNHHKLIATTMDQERLLEAVTDSGRIPAGLVNLVRSGAGSEIMVMVPYGRYDFGTTVVVGKYASDMVQAGRRSEGDLVALL